MAWDASEYIKNVKRLDALLLSLLVLWAFTLHYESSRRQLTGNLDFWATMAQLGHEATTWTPSKVQRLPAVPAEATASLGRPTRIGNCQFYPFASNTTSDGKLPVPLDAYDVTREIINSDRVSAISLWDGCEGIGSANDLLFYIRGSNGWDVPGWRLAIPRATFKQHWRSADNADSTSATAGYVKLSWFDQQLFGGQLLRARHTSPAQAGVNDVEYVVLNSTEVNGQAGIERSHHGGPLVKGDVEEVEGLGLLLASLRLTNLLPISLILLLPIMIAVMHLRLKHTLVRLRGHFCHQAPGPPTTTEIPWFFADAFHEAAPPEPNVRVGHIDKVMRRVEQTLAVLYIVWPVGAGLWACCLLGRAIFIYSYTVVDGLMCLVFVLGALSVIAAIVWGFLSCWQLFAIARCSRSP